MPLDATDHNGAGLADIDEDASLEAAALAEVQARKIADQIIAAAGHGVKAASTVHYSEVHRLSKVGQVLLNEETSDERYQSTVGSSNPWALLCLRPTGN